MSDNNKKSCSKNRNEYLALGLSLGVAFGTTLGVVMDDLAMGIAMGIPIGVMAGIGMSWTVIKSDEGSGEE